MDDFLTASQRAKQHRKDNDDERTSLIPTNLMPLDTGWSWIVLAGSCLVHALFAGQANAIGVLYTDIQEDLGANVIEVSLIGSLRNGFLNSLVLITSPLADHVGCRNMNTFGGVLISLSFFICYFWASITVFCVFLGAISGFGSAMSYAASVIIINNYFRKRRALALIMTQTACSLGVLVFSPLFSYLISIYGLFGTLLINAGLSLNIVVGGFLYFPHTKGYKKDKPSLVNTLLMPVHVYKDKSLWTNYMFYLTMTSSLCHGFGIFIPLTLLPDYMVSKHIPLEIASLSVTMQGASQMISRFITCLILDRCPRLCRILYIVSVIISSLFLYPIPLMKTAAEYILAATGFGLFYGCFSGMLSVILVDLFSSEKLPACFGINYMCLGIASFAGSPVASAVAEVTTISGIEYVLSASVFTVCGLVMVPMLCKTTKTTPTA